MLNTFEQVPVVGQIAITNYATILPCQVSLDQATPLVAGQAVKLENTKGGVPKVVAVTSNSDDTFGFVVYNAKNAEFPAGLAVEVALDGSFIWMKSGASIARGARLELVASTGKVITNAGTNKDIGYCLDKADTADEFVRVAVQTTDLARNTTGGLVQIADVVATLAEINAGKVIIPAIAGKQIKVVDFLAKVTGAFATNTSVDLQDDTTNTKVAVLAQASLTNGANILPLSANVGAGFGVALGLGEALEVVNVGTAGTGGTNIRFVVQYQVV